MLIFLRETKQGRVGDYCFVREVPRCPSVRQKRGCTALSRTIETRSTYSPTLCGVRANGHVHARRTHRETHGTHVRHCTSHAPKFVFNAVRRQSPSQRCAMGSAVSWCAHTFVGCLLWTVCVPRLFCCLLVGSAAFFTQCFSRTRTVCTVYFLTLLTGFTQTEGMLEKHRSTTTSSD